MAPERKLPDQPLVFIQQCVRNRTLQWTYHVNMRLKGRAISRKTILDSVDHYQIIESYPDDKYLPSYLIYTRHEDRVLHILFAADVDGQNVRIVTAYFPDPEEWDADCKIRR